MILQRLYEYAERHMLAEDSAFEEHPVRWLVCIGPDGVLNDLKRLSGGRPGDKRDRGAVLSVPRWQKRAGIHPEPHFLADESRFVLGLQFDGKGGVQQAPEPRERFAALVARAASETRDSGLRIAHSFLLNTSPAALTKSSLVARAGIAPGDTLVLATRVHSVYRPLTEHDAARDWWRKDCARAEGESGVATTCLVTGRYTPAARLHPPISGMAGGRPTGMSLVSFNLDAFCSFGLEQNANAPVSHQAAARYVAALNSLLSRDPARRRCIVLPGDVSVCIFNGGVPEDGAALAVEALDPLPDDLLVADEVVTWRAVEAVYGSPWSGHDAYLPGSDRTPIYALVLTPNSARIVVRDWMESRVDEVVASLRTYFDDLAVIDPFTHRVQRAFLLRTPSAAARREAGTESVATLPRVPTGLLSALRGKGKDDNAPPEVERALVLAALDRRRPFPRELLGAALRRIRAEAAESKYGAVSKERAALIKGAINRELRRPGSVLRHRLTTVDPNFQELKPMLDDSCTIPAYLLGRLMAVLEQAQAKAIPGANATVVDRAYGAASATPATVMPRLLRGVRHHLSKVKSDAPGLAVTYERLLDDICAKFLDPATAFPASLSLQEQGLFGIGYYQQRAELFRPREPKTSGSAA